MKVIITKRVNTGLGFLDVSDEPIEVADEYAKKLIRIGKAEKYVKKRETAPLEDKAATPKRKKKSE